MEISQITLVLLTAYAALWGGAVGAIYDLCRLFRRILGEETTKKEKFSAYFWKLPIRKRELGSIKCKKWVLVIVTNICDFFCAICYTVGILVLCYAYNNGRVRFFVWMSAFIGFFLYKFIVSKVFLCIAEPVVIVIKYIFLSLLVIFLYPFTKIFKFLTKYIKKITYLCILTLEKKRKKVYNIKEEVFVAVGDAKKHSKAFKILPDGQRKEKI